MPWHAAAWEQLGQQLAGGRLPHALLLTGPPDTGVAQCALALARLLLCAAPDGGLNCGRCHGCELSAAGSHGDLRWVEPEEKSRVIKVEQVRDTIGFTHGTAVQGERQVVVLSPADSMNVNACNALLKSLEEPAPGTYLVLVCARLHGVPATIRSRCQLLRLPSPPKQAGLAWLDTVTGDRAASEKLFELAEGRPLLAERLFREDQVEEVGGRKLALRALLAGEVHAPRVWGLWSDSDPGDFLALLCEELQHLARGLPPGDLGSRRGRAVFALLDEVLDLQRAVSAGANPGRQLLVDTLLTKCNRELGAAALGDTI